MKNKKKSSLLILFFILLFLLGTLLFLTALLKEKETEEKYSESKKIAIQSIQEKEDNSPEMIDGSVNLEELNPDKFKEIIKKGTFGILDIPAITVEAPVTKGLTENVLKFYIGMYTTTESPGTIGGNTGLAAHSVMPNTGSCNYCYFNNIDKLKKGDIVSLYWHNGKKYTYSVQEIYNKEIKEADIVYRKEKDESLLTLVTCSNGSSHFRTFVVSKLIKTESI